MLTFRLSSSDQAPPFRWPFPPHERDDAFRPRQGSALLILQEVPARGVETHCGPGRLHLRRMRRLVQRHRVGRRTRGRRGRSQPARELYRIARAHNAQDGRQNSGGYAPDGRSRQSSPSHQALATVIASSGLSVRRPSSGHRIHSIGTSLDKGGTHAKEWANVGVGCVRD